MKLLRPGAAEKQRLVPQILALLLSFFFWPAFAIAQQGGLLPPNMAIMGPTGGVTPALGVPRRPAAADITGLGTMSAQNATAVAITGGTITGLPTPVAAGDASNKSYVDNFVNGFHIHPAVAVATAGSPLPTYVWSATGGGTLTASAVGILTIDGVASSPIGTRILVKDELTSGVVCNGHPGAACDGIYTVTTVGTAGVAYVLTRSAALSSTGSAENVAAGWPGGDSVLVTGGTVNKNSTWLNTVNITTLNTTQFNFGQSQTGGNNPWQIQGSVIYYPNRVEVGPIEGPGFGWFESANDGTTTALATISSISTGFVGGTNHLNAGTAYNYFQIQTDQMGADSPFGESSGMYVFMQTGGALEAGAKVALKAFLQHSVATPTNANKGDHGAIEATAYGTANDGGTALVPAGTLYGMSSAGISDSGATFLAVVSGGEIHADMRTGSSAAHRWGWSMVSAGDGTTGHGSVSEGAIELGGSPGSPASSWNVALLLDGFHGGPALSSTGCVICVADSENIATGMDLSTYTISGNFLKGPSDNFHVTGAGALKAASFAAGASAGVTCSGTPTSSFASVNGIVTHC
jgi:hypothetical protein